MKTLVWVRALEAALDKARRDFAAERRRADELEVFVWASMERKP